MLSSKSLLFAALAAVGVASVMARAEIELSEPMPISLDDLPSNASIPAYIKEITQISLRYGLNETRTLCPCTILDSLVPALSWLDDFLIALVQAILENLLNLTHICITLSDLFNVQHPTPLGWNCCSNCVYCYLPNTTIYILVQIVVLGITITIKLHN